MTTTDGDRRRCAPAILTLLALVPLALSTDDASRPPAADVAAALAEGFGAYLERERLPGLALAVAVDGEIAVEQEFGVRDLDRGDPVSADTLFRAGSVGKLVTAVGLVVLAREGAIDLDASVTDYLPELPEHYAAVTPRHLAGHLAGVRHYRDEVRENLITRQCGSMRGALDLFVADPLEHEPGSAYLYSSYGFTLLGAVMESVLEDDLVDFLGREVLAPLGVAGEFHGEDWGDPTLPRATGYVFHGGERQQPDVNHSCKLATGGWMVTARGLARFLDGVVAGDLLTEDERALLFTPQRTRDGDTTGVGLAWVVGEDERGRAYLHKGGQIVGGRAIALVYPEERVAVAILSNETFAPLGRADALTVAELFLEP